MSKDRASYRYLMLIRHCVLAQAFTEESMAFQTKMVANGGLGQETYLPDGVCPPSPTLNSTTTSGPCSAEPAKLPEFESLHRLAVSITCSIAVRNSCCALPAQASTLPRRASRWRRRGERQRWCCLSLSVRLCGSPTCIPDRYHTSHTQAGAHCGHHATCPGPRAYVHGNTLLTVTDVPQR